MATTVGSYPISKLGPGFVYVSYIPLQVTDLSYITLRRGVMTRFGKKISSDFYKRLLIPNRMNKLCHWMYKRNVTVLR
jgi:hypothetical protein